jgi:hypothetical protein
VWRCWLANSRPGGSPERECRPWTGDAASGGDLSPEKRSLAQPGQSRALAALVEQGVPEVPIAGVFPMAEVRDAYRELERRHTLGMIVLQP